MTNHLKKESRCLTISTIIIQETGEIIENVSKIITKNQLDIITKKNKEKLSRNKENFIFLTFQKLNKLNLSCNQILEQADIARIIYMSTFLNYSNKLMETERKSMTKDILLKKINIERSGFNRFYKRLLLTNILIEKDNELFLNKQYCFCGKLNKNNNKSNDVTRIYKTQIRFLYENIENTKHKQLSVLYLLIPFLNIKYNIICENPLEEDKEKIKPMTIEDLSIYFKYNLQSFILLVDFLSDLRDKDNTPVIKQIINNRKNKKYNSIVVNPRVIYGGDDIKYVESFYPIFNI